MKNINQKDKQERGQKNDRMMCTTYMRKKKRSKWEYVMWSFWLFQKWNRFVWISTRTLHFFIRPQKKKWENENEKKRNWKRTLQLQIELLSLNRKCVCFFFLFQQIQHRTKACQLKHWIINFGRKRSSNKSIFILIPLPKYLFYIYRDTTSVRFSLLQLVFFFFFVCVVVGVCRCHFYNAASMILCDIRYCLPFDFGIQCRFCFTLFYICWPYPLGFWQLFFGLFFFSLSYNRLWDSVLGYFAHIFFCVSSLMFLFVLVVATQWTQAKHRSFWSSNQKPYVQCSDFRSPCHWKSLYGFIYTYENWWHNRLLPNQKRYMTTPQCYSWGYISANLKNGIHYRMETGQSNWFQVNEQAHAQWKLIPLISYNIYTWNSSL